jgi:type IV pilus assembly protein PilC
MKNDEFAFFNQQLAAMLRDGIPLEGALRHLCADLRSGPLRTELEQLGADLARGTPLAQAVRARRLPELYQRMLEVGAASNDLPGVLTLLADHYQRSQAISTRLKGLMVYPALVLSAAFLLSCFLAFVLHELTLSVFSGSHLALPIPIFWGLWSGPVLFGLLMVALFMALITPWVRRSLRWRLPAFREASLAQVSSALALMLRSGVPLKNAVAQVIQLEKGTLAETELARWWQNLADGRGKFSEMAAGGKVFPPLFVWMIGQSGEDLAGGFQRVSDSYLSRASYRSDLLLYSALPCAVLGLGAMIIMQIVPVFGVFSIFIRSLSGD